MKHTTVDAMRVAARRLAAAGVETPRACAEWLLSDLTALPRPSLYATPRALRPAEATQYADWVGRVCRGVPPAYLTQRAWFCGLELAVRPGVFIPRPETEILVEAAAARWGGRSSSPWLGVDLGTGSGNIAVSLTALWLTCRMTAIDCSAEALAVARHNAVAHGVADRIRLVLADLRDVGWVGAVLAATPRPFDLVITNPPYIASDAIAALPPIVRSEPWQALDGGPDGLALVRRIVAGSPALLRSEGWLALEIGEDQAAAVTALIATTGAFHAAEVVRDLSGRDRVVLAQRR